MGASQTKAVLAETMKNELVYSSEEAAELSVLLGKLRASHLAQIPSCTKFMAGECFVQAFTGSAAVVLRLVDGICAAERVGAAFDFKSLLDKKDDSVAKISIVLINSAPAADGKKKQPDAQSQKNFAILYSGAMFGNEVSILWNKLSFASLEGALKTLLDSFGGGAS